jgi:hypothetical protein
LSLYKAHLIVPSFEHVILRKTIARHFFSTNTVVWNKT